jgi:hypothetical protein
MTNKISDQICQALVKLLQIDDSCVALEEKLEDIFNESSIVREYVKLTNELNSMYDSGDNLVALVEELRQTRTDDELQKAVDWKDKLDAVTFDEHTFQYLLNGEPLEFKRS